MPIRPGILVNRSARAALLAGAVIAAGVVVAAPTQGWAAVPQQGYADLVEKVSPAVVFIEVTARAPVQQMAGRSPFGPSSPLEEFFKHFGIPGPGSGAPGEAPESQVRRGVGSGFIISGDGEIVTNNHVVEGATEIMVKLNDGREFKAEVVGTDPLTDIALLRLENAADLPVVSIGDSSQLRVGDPVVAVGNPFGLGGTVTSGIVSALNRNINAGPYDAFIQTDAAINRGNSGGPLFNTEGEVVGMNTAIFSPTGGSIGIGFSVPASTLGKVVADLRDDGAVDRGWLGVQIQPVTADLAEALGLDEARGALVSKVIPDSPASRTDLQSGDLIVAVNGAAVESADTLPNVIADIPAGETARIAVLRDGARKEIAVEIGALTPEKLGIASDEPSGSQQEQTTKLGVTVHPLTPQLAQQLGLKPDAGGVVVAEVDPDSPNADRLQAGDVILQAAGQEVTSPRSLREAIAGSKDAVLLRISRGGQELFVGAALAAG